MEEGGRDRNQITNYTLHVIFDMPLHTITQQYIHTYMYAQYKTPHSVTGIYYNIRQITTSHEVWANLSVQNHSIFMQQYIHSSTSCMQDTKCHILLLWYTYSNNHRSQGTYGHCMPRVLPVCGMTNATKDHGELAIAQDMECKGQ